MAVPLIIAGTVLQMAGQYGANLAQAEAELQNARFYAKQKDLATTAYVANLTKEAVQYNYQRGRVVSAIAGGGADVGSGSSAIKVASLAARNLAAVAQIKEQSMLDIELARSRAARSTDMATTLKSPGYNALQAGTTALTGYAQYLGTKQGAVPDFRGQIQTPSVYSLPTPGTTEYTSNYLFGNSGGYQK